MFTGIIQAVGNVEKIEGKHFGFRWPKFSRPYVIGESIAIDGCCLTVVEMEDDVFYVDVVDETLDRTIVSTYSIGDRVNLEAAMSVGDSFGGHFVLGHIDTTGKVTSVGDRLRVEFNPIYSKYIVEKGSIAISGTSLTIASCEDGYVEIALIPHTKEVTTLGSLEIGDLVNLEFDTISKQVVKVAEAQFGQK
ncbi:MAG: riboflavin synthase [Actinomycetota bacterium]|nr:riboflavin synthase [Actinomycetota bacterium]